MEDEGPARGALQGQGRGGGGDRREVIQPGHGAAESGRPRVQGGDAVPGDLGGGRQRSELQHEEQRVAVDLRLGPVGWA
eukprot:12049809-Alexandrium_andersonii.AAC.1